MQELEAIRGNSLYIQCYKRLEKIEAERQFCRHHMPHFLDVARIAFIRNLEQGFGLRKELIYAAALLHDIGKARQYEEGIPHEIAGREIAELILNQVEMFSADENQEILQAILQHRRERSDMTTLGRLLYESDKASRACYACPAEKECNWDSQSKNMVITE